MRITQTEALEMLQSDPEIKLVDVRTFDEYARGHIPGAVCIPYASLDSKLEETFPEKNEKIILYCQSGKKCMSLGTKLEKMGYVNIYQAGGIVTWPGDIEIEPLSLMRERHSVRQYLDTPIEDDIKASIEKLIQTCNHDSGLNIQLICDEKDCFKSFLASYGRFKNVSNYIALVGKAADKELDEKAGYYGMRIVLEAQSRGLNTCWVGGTFSKGKCKAAVAEDEKLVCVIAIGHGESAGSAHKSKSADRLTDVKDDNMPEWFERGLEAAMLAPTALNQQKFFLSIDEDKAVIRIRRGPFVRVDLGIVKYCFEFASGHKCVNG
jgi:rhodanese-related sulfurtransferase/nitroreductase